MSGSQDNGAAPPAPHSHPPTLDEVSEVERHWNDFVDGSPPSSSLRDTIAASWERCRAAGLTPSGCEPRRVSPEELEERRRVHHGLVEASRKQLARLSAYLEPVEHAICVTDRDGIILHGQHGVAPGAERSHFFEPGVDCSEELIGTNGVGTALETRSPVAIVGPEHFCRSHHRRVCTAAPIKGPSGEVVGALNITVGFIEGVPFRMALVIQTATLIEEHLARKAATEQLDSTHRFLAQINHEVRTPLTLIRGCVNLLDASDPTSRRAVELIERSSNHLIDLVDDVLEFSQVQNGNLPLDQKEFSVSALMCDAAEMMKVMADEQGVSLRVVPPTSTPPIICSDERRLRQILLNLLSNAIKFTPAGGNVTLRAVKLDERPSLVRFEVEDNGIGIPARHIDSIFQPFHTLDPRPDAPNKSTGLGLTITRELVEALGGEIEVESEPGQGSTFRFELELDALP